MPDRLSFPLSIVLIVVLAPLVGVGAAAITLAVMGATP